MIFCNNSGLNTFTQGGLDVLSKNWIIMSSIGISLSVTIVDVFEFFKSATWTIKVDCEIYCIAKAFWGLCKIEKMFLYGTTFWTWLFVNTFDVLLIILEITALIPWLCFGWDDSLNEPLISCFWTDGISFNTWTEVTH